MGLLRKKKLNLNRSFNLSNNPFAQEQIMSMELLQNLQKSLHFEELINIFSTTIHSFLKIRSIQWLSRRSQAASPRNTAHELFSIIAIDDEIIGYLKFNNPNKFTSEESKLLLSLSKLLVYPLKNSLVHQEALNSAQQDPLTQLQNRKSMAINLQICHETASRYKQSLSILLVDIDYFKRINDTFGHPIGDKVLKHLSKILQLCCRGADQAFRFGGEEFLISLPITNQQGAIELAERLRKAIEIDTFEHILTKKDNLEYLPITVSIGLATLLPDESLDSLIHRADKALYSAKANGRNIVSVAHF